MFYICGIVLKFYSFTFCFLFTYCFISAQDTAKRSYKPEYRNIVLITLNYARHTPYGTMKERFGASNTYGIGTGYAANFDPEQFQSVLSSQGSEHHEIRLTVPRSYLYLHEWALDNGNSQLGLSVNVTLNTSSGYDTWSLNPTSKLVGDVESLAVLELSEKPTDRFTVDVHVK